MQMPSILTLPLAACYATFSALGAHMGCLKASETQADLRIAAAKGALILTTILSCSFTGIMLLGLMAFGAFQGDSLFRVLSFTGFFLFLVNGGLAAVGAFCGAYIGPKAACLGAALMAVVGVFLGPW